MPPLLPLALIPSVAPPLALLFLPSLPLVPLPPFMLTVISLMAPPLSWFALGSMMASLLSLLSFPPLPWYTFLFLVLCLWWRGVAPQAAPWCCGCPPPLNPWVALGSYPCSFWLWLGHRCCPWDSAVGLAPGAPGVLNLGQIRSVTIVSLYIRPCPQVPRQ